MARDIRTLCVGRYVVVMPRWPAAGAGHLVRVVMLAYKSIDEPLPACKVLPLCEQCRVELCTWCAWLWLTAHTSTGNPESFCNL